MTHMTVSEVMSSNVASVREDTPFREIARVLADRRISAVPVVDAGNRVLGVVSEADLLPALEMAEPDRARRRFLPRLRRFARGVARGGATARDLMSSPAVMVPTQTTVAAAARLLETSQIKRMPVVDDLGRLIGIVSRNDLMKVFLRADAAIARDVVEDVLRHGLWIGPDEVTVDVADGVVTLTGEVEDRSLIPIVTRLVDAVDGVMEIVDRLTYRVDDSVLTEARFYRRLT